MRLSLVLGASFFGALLVVNAIAEEFNPVVGKIGEFVLREADLERLVSHQSPEIQKSLADPGQRALFVRQILLTKGAAERAKKDGFHRTPDIKEQLSYLVDNYLAQEYIRKTVLAKVTVPDEDIRQYYKEHQDEFHLPPEAEARHIFFELADDIAPEKKREIRGKAEAILVQIRKGEDFDRLARDHSEDAETAAKGGNLGVISPGKTNSREFEGALFSLKKGETSGVVETPFGFHIIRVDEMTEQRTASLEEAQSYIENLLKGQYEQLKAQEFLDMVAKEGGMDVAGEKPVVQSPEPAKLPETGT